MPRSKTSHHLQIDRNMVLLHDKNAFTTRLNRGNVMDQNEGQMVPLKWQESQ